MKTHLKKLYYSYYLFKLKPILLYTAPKTGSISLLKSLEDQYYWLPYLKKHNIIFTHSLNEKWLLRNSKNNNEIIRIKSKLEKGKPLKVITTVRHPINQLISYFYYFGISGRLFQKKNGREGLRGENYFSIDTRAHLPSVYEEMKNTFFKDFYWGAQIDFFPEEIEKFLNINVFDFPFNKSLNYLNIKKGNIDLLILKVDQGINEKALNEFIGSKTTITQKNKNYDNDYAIFKRQILSDIKTNTDFLEYIYFSDFYKHFYA